MTLPFYILCFASFTFVSTLSWTSRQPVWVSQYWTGFYIWFKSIPLLYLFLLALNNHSNTLILHKKIHHGQLQQICLFQCQQCIPPVSPIHLLLRFEEGRLQVHSPLWPCSPDADSPGAACNWAMFALCDKVEGTVFTPWFQDVRRSKQVHLLSRFNSTHQQEHPNRHLCHLQKFPQIIASKNKDFIILYQNFPKKQSGTDS